MRPTAAAAVVGSILWVGLQIKPVEEQNYIRYRCGRAVPVPMKASVKSYLNSEIPVFKIVTGSLLI